MSQPNTHRTPETASILVSCRLLNIERSPGDTLTAEELGRIPKHNLEALVRQNIVDLDGTRKYEPSEAEKKATKKEATAKTAVKTAENTLESLRKDVERINSEILELQNHRKALALKVARGNETAKQQSEKYRQELAHKMIALEDTTAAIGGAEAELQVAKDKLREAKIIRRQAEIQHLITERVTACRQIEEAVDILAPLLSTYRKLGFQVARALRDGSEQTYGDWRIKSYLNSNFALDFVDPALRFASLSELEDRVLNERLKYACTTLEEKI